MLPLQLFSHFAYAYRIMKSKLFLLAAVALSTAACQQEKPSTITATVPEASRDTAVVVSDTITYRNDARHLTDRVAEDIKLTDAAARRRLEYAYYTRNRRLSELQTQYTTDTTGRYAALRSVNDDTDREIRTIVTEPSMYNTYESNRARYYDGGPYTVVVKRQERRGPKIVSYEQKKGGTKIEYSNGTTVKIDKDGDRKVEYPNGTKVKTDADDGERKVKR
jgi:hypothetical protein